MRGRRAFGVVALATLILLPGQVAEAACEFNGRYIVYPGIFSSEWAAEEDILAFNAASGFPVTFAGTFHSLHEGRGNTIWTLDQVFRAGATPVAHLEVPYTAAEMASGLHDGAIREWALWVRTWLWADPAHSVIIAPMQEMNGDWVPWGMDPANFRIAYRRVVETFSEMGMDETQVRWMFAPNGVSVAPYTAADYWPGTDVVDFVGLSAYNFGHEFGEWASVDDILLAETDELQPLAWDKPFLVSQIGTSAVGGDREDWLSDMFDFVARHPNLVGFIYFNFDKETNWRIWDGVSVADGWLLALEDDRVRYDHPLDPWFRPGPIPFRFDVQTAHPRPEQFCFASAADRPPFPDVPDGLYYSEPIDLLVDAGVVTGYEDGTFRPDRTVTRSEAVVLLWRLACAPDVGLPSGMTDGDGWFSDALDWAVATETVRGLPSGSFNPEDPITRADLSLMMWRLNDCPEPASLGGLTDVRIRDYFGGAVGWMAESNITTGVAPDRFAPDEEVTRGEMATFLSRMIAP